jgi:thiosulfate/3-mercaptopyruvate sulfurtransferase
MANSPLKSVEWLTKNLGRDKLVTLDASWHMPSTGRNALNEYREAHIPGAQFFDIDAIVDPDAEQPHTLPTAKGFAAAVKNLGITNGSKIVVYDNSDFRTAARAWWMFRAMGHKNVYVLDGGLALWKAQKQPTESGNVTAEKSIYYAEYNPALYLTKDDILANLDSKEHQIVDARAKGRYAGTTPEPRPGLRSGHITGALNLPYGELYDEDGTLYNDAILIEKIRAAYIDLSAPIGTSCGSGVTACCLALAFAKLGKWNTAIYDGSWSEWGIDATLPIETGNTKDA